MGRSARYPWVGNNTNTSNEEYPAMTNFDRFFDRTIPHGPSGVDGLSSFDVARLISAGSRGRHANSLDCNTLRDLGYDGSTR